MVSLIIFATNLNDFSGIEESFVTFHLIEEHQDIR